MADSITASKDRIFNANKPNKAKFPLRRGTENDLRSFSGGCESVKSGNPTNTSP